MSHQTPTELTVEFDPESYLVNEGGQVTLVIVKQGEAAAPISVTLSTQDGTATGDHEIKI